MASIKSIKKDIDYLIGAVVEDSYLAIIFQDDKKDDVIKVIEKAVDLRNSLFDKVNDKSVRKDRKATKLHFSKIRKEMFEGVDKLFEKLSKAVAVVA